MKINEIFRSIDGEVNKWGQGIWSTFIRTQGCNLRCSYCDTKQAQDRWSGGSDMSIPEIMAKVYELKVRKVTITGGEPLIQEETIDLINSLWTHHFEISLETNGSQPLGPILNSVNIVMDYKLPSSGQERFMDLDNFYLLKASDCAKFVIGNEEDYERAKEVVKGRKKCLAKYYFSPTIPGFDPLELMKRMEQDELFNLVGLNVQIHKLIGVR